MHDLIDTQSYRPLRISLIRSGVSEPRINAALDEYFEQMAEYARLQDVAGINSTTQISSDLDADEIARRIVAARTMESIPPTAQHNLLTALSEHYEAWTAAALKRRDQARQKLIKVLAQLPALLDEVQTHSGTVQMLEDHSRLVWKPGPEQFELSEVADKAAALTAKLAALTTQDQAEPEQADKRAVDEIRIG